MPVNGANITDDAKTITGYIDPMAADHAVPVLIYPNHAFIKRIPLAVLQLQWSYPWVHGEYDVA